MNVCVVIPVYNHELGITTVIEQLKLFSLPCLMINDGSSEQCSAVLSKLAQQESQWITLCNREVNGGKGAAVKDGLLLAIKLGYSHVIQIDADGQHRLEDIPHILGTCENYPDRLILGQPIFDQSVPKKRLYGRQLTNIWIWINTLSFAIKDGMCGFRCYPLNVVEELLQQNTLGNGMDFDIEIVVRLYWKGINVINLPTEVQYPVDGISHFKMLHDNLLISSKHAQLFFGMLWRLPQLLVRHIQ